MLWSIKDLKCKFYFDYIERTRHNLQPYMYDAYMWKERIRTTEEKLKVIFVT